MRIQDSLYYQDFSYVIKVGRAINDWRDSFKKTILNLETTVETMNSSLSSFNSIIDSSKVDFDITLNNTKKITSNFVKFSDTIVNANFGSTIKTFQTTLDNVNTLLSNIENGSGTVGKLMKKSKKI